MEQINIVAMGIIVVFIGMILIFFGAFSQVSKQPVNESKSSAKVAVGGFIGPFLFGFGNDRQLSKILVIASAAFFIIWILFQWYMKK